MYRYLESQYFTNLQDWSTIFFYDVDQGRREFEPIQIREPIPIVQNPFM